jgi:hypothetical protein
LEVSVVDLRAVSIGIVAVSVGIAGVAILIESATLIESAILAESAAASVLEALSLQATSAPAIANITKNFFIVLFRF